MFVKKWQSQRLTYPRESQEPFSWHASIRVLYCIFSWGLSKFWHVNQVYRRLNCPMWAHGFLARGGEVSSLVCILPAVQSRLRYATAAPILHGPVYNGAPVYTRRMELRIPFARGELHGAVLFIHFPHITTPVLSHFSLFLHFKTVHFKVNNSVTVTFILSIFVFQVIK